MDAHRAVAYRRSIIDVEVYASHDTRQKIVNFEGEGPGTNETKGTHFVLDRSGRDPANDQNLFDQRGARSADTVGENGRRKFR